MAKILINTLWGYLLITLGLGLSSYAGVAAIWFIVAPFMTLIIAGILTDSNDNDCCY